MVKVFAYGTLRPSGYPHMIKRFDLKPVGGTATIEGEFVMISLGGFPGLVKRVGQRSTIVGEVSEVASLEALDAYEGYPRLYTREEVVTGDGTKAWVYFFNAKPGEISQYRKIETGDWMEEVKGLKQARQALK